MTTSSFDRLTVGGTSENVAAAGARRATTGATEGAAKGTATELAMPEEPIARLFFGARKEPAPGAALFREADGRTSSLKIPNGRRIPTDNGAGPSSASNKLASVTRLFWEGTSTSFNLMKSSRSAASPDCFRSGGCSSPPTLKENPKKSEEKRRRIGSSNRELTTEDR